MAQCCGGPASIAPLSLLLRASPQPAATNSLSFWTPDVLSWHLSFQRWRMSDSDPPTHPTFQSHSYNDVGHSNSARKTLDKYLIGELDEEGKAKVGTGKSGSGGSSVLPYALAAVALAAALVYQFGLPKK